MGFVFSFNVFLEIFLSPFYRNAREDQVVSLFRTVTEEDTSVTQYRYSLNGHEMAWTQADGSEYTVTFFTGAVDLIKEVHILQNREGARPGGDLVRMDLSYKSDTLIDTVRFYVNDSLRSKDRYFHDASGRIDKVMTIRYGLDPSAKKEYEKAFSYDSLGRLSLIVEETGAKHRFVHDGLNRLTEKWVMGAAATEFDLRQTFRYNSAGRLETSEKFYAGDFLSTTTFEYAPLSQVLAVRSRDWAKPTRGRSRGSIPLFRYHDVLGRLDLVER